MKLISVRNDYYGLYWQEKKDFYKTMISLGFFSMPILLTYNWSHTLMLMILNEITFIGKWQNFMTIIGFRPSN